MNHNEISPPQILIIPSEKPTQSTSIALNQTALVNTPVHSTNRNNPIPKSEIWKIMYANIRGIKGKRSSLIEHLECEKPQIFLLTETLLPTNSGIQITGFTFFGKSRLNKKGGGIGILISDEIKNLISLHTSERNLEIMWIGIRRKNHHPLFIGCYYGKQETRCNKEEITEEMRLLSEEIEELKHEGNILIFMDGNGKVGLLGEEKSRNGILLEEVFEAQDLTLMNKNKICTGKITRQNTKNANENSAIDFVVAD